MKKKTYYEFKKPNVQFDFVVDINPKGHSIWEEYVNEVYQGDDKDSLPISSDMKNFIEKYEDEFLRPVYDFIREYDKTFKTLKMKPSHRSNGCSIMEVTFRIKNGVGKVFYCPYDQENIKHEKKMWGEFNVKKEDVLDFLNSWSKVQNFKNNEDEIEVEKTEFVVYRISVNGEETYDVLTQDPYDIGSAISVSYVVSNGKKIPMSKWEKIEELLRDNY